MAGDATVQPVARPRGDLDDLNALRVKSALNKATKAESELRRVCVEAVEASSFRAVSEATGFSTNTLQRWKREAGQ